MPLPPNSQVTRGHVYDKSTGRWLGPVAKFEDPPEPTPADMLPDALDLNLTQLRSMAKEIGLSGYTQMKIAELREALVAAGQVQLIVAVEEEENAEDQSEGSEGDSEEA